MSGGTGDFGATFIPGCNINNFEYGRQGNSVNLIVAHHTATTFQGTVNTFVASPPVHSAHFIIDRVEDAEGFAGLWQMVMAVDTAYHAANYPINLSSIGVETVQNDPEPFLDCQYRTWHRLANQIAAFYGWPLVLGTTLRPHRDFTATSCPGSLSLPTIIAGVPPKMATLEDSVSNVKVDGTVFQPAAYYLWSGLTSTPPVITPVGKDRALGPATYTDAVKLSGAWYDRTTKDDGTPGEYAIADANLDTGGTDPSHYKPVPPPVVPPVVPPVPVPVPVPVPPPVVTGTPIMGASVATNKQMYDLLSAHNVLAFDPPEEAYRHKIVNAYLYNTEGVRGDGAFAQAMHETGWLQFGGDVKKSQNNFAGIGATGGGAPGLSFPTVEDGVNAHCRHLRAYATKEQLPNDGIDPRSFFVPRGSATTFHALGTHWAPAADYGDRIEALLTEMLSVTPVPTPIPIPAPVVDLVAVNLAFDALKKALGR